MAKLTLDTVASLQSEPSALQTMAANGDKIEAAIEKTLSRDGTGPNQMEASLDLNGHRLMNLPAPQAGTDAARLADLAAMSLTDVVLPAFVPEYILSNSSGALIWMDPSTLPGVGDMRGSNNLAELTNVVEARTNLGLGSAATRNVGTSGAALGLLNSDLVFGGNNTSEGSNLFTGPVTLGGTANHRLSTNPTALTQDSLGFRVPPTNVQDTTYTLVLNDAAKALVHTSASPHTWTIPPESAVAYPGTTQILLVNTGAGAVTIARGSGVALRIAGTSVDKNMSLAQHGVATLIRASANTFYIVGVGVS